MKSKRNPKCRIPTQSAMYEAWSMNWSIPGRVGSTLLRMHLVQSFHPVQQLL
ncbi:hypothetical protein ABIE66_006044 [Peribacillus sp. B2I2]|uniref:hypothetical protein n=1 Tax=Peribacillus sp. B2I2 TaxID=3156468 RepID=UPI0035184ABA